MTLDNKTYNECQKEIEAMEERFGGKWKELCLGVSNLACGDALDKLWQDIILVNDPDYGDWEYPGQAYRHLLTEYEDLKAKVNQLEETTWQGEFEHACRELHACNKANEQLEQELDRWQQKVDEMFKDFERILMSDTIDDAISIASQYVVDIEAFDFT